MKLFQLLFLFIIIIILFIIIFIILFIMISIIRPEDSKIKSACQSLSCHLKVTEYLDWQEM